MGPPPVRVQRLTPGERVGQPYPGRGDLGLLAGAAVDEASGLGVLDQRGSWRPGERKAEIPLSEKWFDKIGDSPPTSMRDELEH
jgi:hypothetical protein